VYLSSNKVHVFPLGTHRSEQLTDHLLSEVNLRNIIRSTTEIPSFVISETFDPTGSFEFVIDGYYFVLEGSKQTPLKFSGSKVYAAIVINKMSPSNPLLCGADTIDNNDQTVFTGIQFCSSESETSIEIPELVTDYEVKYLHILNEQSPVGSGTYSINENSRARFSNATINNSLTEVDGGVV